jgi:hypothetical protein
MSGHQEDKRQLALKTLALFKKMLCEMDYTNAAGTCIEDFEAIGVPAVGDPGPKAIGVPDARGVPDAQVVGVPGPKAIGVPDARGDPEPKAERETLELSLAAVRLAFGQWPDTMDKHVMACAASAFAKWVVATVLKTEGRLDVDLLVAMMDAEEINTD